MRIGIINSDQPRGYRGGRGPSSRDPMRERSLGRVPERIRMVDEDFDSICRQFKEGGAPLTPWEKAMARSNWENGKDKARRHPSLSEERELFP